MLSIIIPIYKVESYLSQCIDSVLSQDYHDIEVILVDDGSPDKCPVICDEYAQKDSRIKVIHKENGGLSSARNAGIKLASGDYLVFLDSDDWWNEKVSLAKMIIIVKNNPDIEMFIFDSIDYCNDDGGKFFKRRYSSPNYNKKYTTIEAYKYFVEIDDLHEAAYNKILSRKTVLNNDLFFKDGILSEDIDWMYRVMRTVKSIIFIPYDLIIYRLGRTGSISNSIKAKNILDMLSAIRQSVEYSKNNQLAEIINYELACCAKLWFIVLGLYRLLDNRDKKIVIGELKALSFVADYSASKKTKLVNGLYRSIGFSLTSIVLSIYYAKFRIIANRKIYTGE